MLHGFHPNIVSETELELHDALSPTQKAKQLGSDKHPAFTYRGMAALQEPTRKVWGQPYANIVSGCYMANPSAVFRAMADGDPYPVKALISLGNNTLMGFANMALIHRAMMNPGPDRRARAHQDADGATGRLHPAGRCLDGAGVDCRRFRLDIDLPHLAAGRFAAGRSARRL